MEVGSGAEYLVLFDDMVVTIPAKEGSRLPTLQMKTSNGRVLSAWWLLNQQNNHEKVRSGTGEK